MLSLALLFEKLLLQAIRRIEAGVQLRTATPANTSSNITTELYPAPHKCIHPKVLSLHLYLSSGHPPCVVLLPKASVLAPEDTLRCRAMKIIWGNWDCNVPIARFRL
jgi:hypothetical protein